MAVINEQLTRLTSTGGTTLGLALFISLGIALWSASSGVKTMFEAMNVAYDERESRNFFVLNATALLFTLAGIVGAMLMIGAAVLMPIVLEFIGLGTGFEWLIRIGSYVLLALALVVGSTVMLMLISDFGQDRILFEVISAFATVGMSTGITAGLPPAGQVVLIVLMFVGRLGPVTEGGISWVVGLGALIGCAVWLGAKAR